VIKAQQFRTQDANKQDAIKRLHDIVNAANHVNLTRHATRPTYGSKQRRLATKNQRGQVKVLRRRVREE